MKSLLYIIIPMFFLICCASDNILNKATHKAEKLWTDIANDNAEGHFLEEYFPKEGREWMLAELKDKCDFKNRRGGLKNSSYKKDSETKINYLELIYGFDLKCGHLKITLLYDIDDSVILKGFHVKED